MIAEVFLPAFGSLGIGGVIAFAIGAVMLVDTDIPGFGIPLSLIVVLALTTLAFIFAVSAAALKARQRPVVTGGEQMVGSTGIVIDDATDESWARVHGEQWRVRSSVPLRRGDAVRVVGMDGLVLVVTPVNQGVPS